MIHATLGPSFRGACAASEPGIHIFILWLWIPALAAARRGRNDEGRPPL